jgi:hypothetical protein
MQSIMPNLDHEALALLSMCEPGDWKGRTVSSYKLPNLASRLEWDVRFSRSELRDFCQMQSNSTEHCVIAIMAWGGAKAEHLRQFWASKGQWLHIAEQVRNENSERRIDYQRFSDLRRKNALPGVGPAYFTKLLWFLRCRQDAYIMDQWTARSVAILIPENAPMLQNKTRVSDRNSDQHYESFCIALECIAASLGVSPEKCEATMFSQGGRNPLNWRKFVLSHGQT